MKNKYIYGIGIMLTLLIFSMPFCFAAEMSLIYDANGNLITGDGKFRTYNSFNQLWRIYNGSNSSGYLMEEFTYHPVEERVFVKQVYNTSGSVIETTYYINQNFVQVINNSGVFNFTYYYIQGQLVAQDLNGVKTFFATDNKGNVVAVMNSSGNVTETNSYSPFGELLTGGNKSRYGYEGKEYDKTSGQTDFNARMLLGPQFSTPDPLIQNVYDPQSLNRYAFEKNNPVKNTDPTGHIVPLIIPLIIIGIAIYQGYKLGENLQTVEEYQGDLTPTDYTMAALDILLMVIPAEELLFLVSEGGKKGYEGYFEHKIEELRKIRANSPMTCDKDNSAACANPYNPEIVKPTVSINTNDQSTRTTMDIHSDYTPDTTSRTKSQIESYVRYSDDYVKATHSLNENSGCTSTYNEARGGYDYNC